MNFVDDLSEFVPFNEQEKCDKEYFFEFIQSFDDVLTRDNIFGHFCASGYVLNKAKTKILLVNHNIFGGFIIPGGHVDGETDFFEVAKREIEEETGLKPVPLDEKVFSIWNCGVRPHIKRGKFVSAHLHLDFDYLFEANDSVPLKVKPDENSSVIWADIDEVGKSIKLVDFFVPEFEKFKEKLKEML